MLVEPFGFAAVASGASLTGPTGGRHFSGADIRTCTAKHLHRHREIERAVSWVRRDVHELLATRKGVVRESPDCSLPNRSAARFAGTFCQISAAHSRGFTAGTTIVRSRALAPATKPQSAIASPRICVTRAFARISSAPAARAVASSLGNAARGLTSTSRRVPSSSSRARRRRCSPDATSQRARCGRGSARVHALRCGSDRMRVVPAAPRRVCHGSATILRCAPKCTAWSTLRFAPPDEPAS